MSSASASGGDLIAATALAYEVQCRLADAWSIRSQGWDHVCYGAFSTALGAGKLLGLDLASLKAQALDLLEQILNWLQSPAFYAQIGLIAGALVLASLSARLVRGYLPEQAAAVDGSFAWLRRLLPRVRQVLFPVFAVLLLAIAISLSQSLLDTAVIARMAQGLSVVALIYTASR